jgi:hypothetical protein
MVLFLLRVKLKIDRVLAVSAPAGQIGLRVILARIVSVVEKMRVKLGRVQLIFNAGQLMLPETRRSPHSERVLDRDSTSN